MLSIYAWMLVVSLCADALRNCHLVQKPTPTGIGWNTWGTLHVSHASDMFRSYDVINPHYYCNAKPMALLSPVVVLKQLSPWELISLTACHRASVNYKVRRLCKLNGSHQLSWKITLQKTLLLSFFDLAVATLRKKFSGRRIIHGMLIMHQQREKGHMCYMWLILQPTSSIKNWLSLGYQLQLIMQCRLPDMQLHNVWFVA